VIEDRDVDVALLAAERAGAAALALQGRVCEETKLDRSPVSEADRAAHDILVATLQEAFPDDGLLSEEGEDDERRLEKRRVWLVDPIDGTRAYLDGGVDWAVQVALAVDGEALLGVIVQPALARSYYGIVGRGAWRVVDGIRRPVRPVRQASGVLIASRRNRERTAEVSAALPEFELMHRSSVGVKVAHLLDGDADCYVHLRPMAEWDVAAPAALLLGAGGSATDLHGAALRYNSPEARCPGIVFSIRIEHGAIIERLRHLR
jgi:3'(2'),5'-bisphosphate nucleotidase